MNVAIIDGILNRKCDSNSLYLLSIDKEVKSYDFGVWVIIISKEVISTYYSISINSMYECVEFPVDYILDISYIDLGTKSVLRVKCGNDKIYRFYEDCRNYEQLRVYEIRS